MKKILIGVGVLAILMAGYLLFVKSKSGDMQMEIPVIQNESSEPSPVVSESPKTSSPAANPAPASPTTHAVTIRDFSFSPSTLTIKKGDTIVWTNKDSAPHTVTWDVAGQQSSGTLKSGETFSFTFNSAGTFSYHCAFHPSMKGKIVAQ